MQIIENEANSWAITKNGLSYRYTDNVEKSKSGNPLVRALVYLDDDYKADQTVLNLVSNNESLANITIPTDFKETDFKEIAHKSYDLYLNDRLLESNVALKLGGVYTVVGYASNATTVARTITVTEPNSLHIFYIIPQQCLLSISEIMVDVLVLEFAFSQAPVSMKSLLQSFWLLAAFFGNLIIIGITEAHFFERKVC